MSKNQKSSATSTIKVDERGRAVIPQPVRQVLGIDNKKAILEVEITIKEKLIDEADEL